MASIASLTLKVNVVVSVSNGSPWSRLKSATARVLDRIASRRPATMKPRIDITVTDRSAVPEIMDGSRRMQKRGRPAGTMN